jgi:hypothetical protein
MPKRRKWFRYANYRKESRIEYNAFAGHNIGKTRVEEAINMKIISKLGIVTATCAAIIILTLAPPANAQSSTNSPAFEPIVFDNVPLDMAIQALARELDINYLVDPRLTQWWEMTIPDSGMTHMPIVNFRTTNITPREALQQILAEHHLVLLEDPQTDIARITYPKQKISTLDYIESDTNEESLPIQFTDVPLDVCFEALAREAGINYLIDPAVGYGRPDRDGKIQQPPTLTLRWDHVTAAQGFYALSENYGFTVERDPNSHIVFLRIQDHPITPFTNTKFFEGDTNYFAPMTNTVSPIQAEDVPLNVIMQVLANEAKVAVELDPTDDNLSLQTVSFRFTNVSSKQALVALCEDYNLVFTVDPGSGSIRIGQRRTIPPVLLVPNQGKG